MNTSLIKRENEKNGHAIIQVSKNGENSIFIHSGTNAMIKKEYVDNVLSHFGKGDIIILQNEINLVGYIIDAAYKKEMFIILNPSPMNEKIFELDFSKISCLVANEAETKAIFKSDDFNSISRIAKRDYPGIKLMLTRGLDGSVYIDSDKIYNQNAFVVDVVDTTAAGDSFMGYFVSGIVQKRTFCEVLRLHQQLQPSQCLARVLHHQSLICRRSRKRSGCWRSAAHNLILNPPKDRSRNML